MKHSDIPARLTVSLLVSALAAACSPDLSTETATPPDLARGGQPGGGTGGTGLAPTTLGSLKVIRCAGSSANDVSSGLSPLVVGGATGCGDPLEKAFIWSATTGLAQAGGAPGRVARAVSDGGTMVGLGQAFNPVVSDLSGEPAALPLPTPYVYGDAKAITRDGLHAVGYGEGNGFGSGLLWSRTSSSGAWGFESIGSGRPYGVADGGTMVVGISSGLPAVWRRVAGSWEIVALGSVPGRALGVTPSGTVIVGEVWDPAVDYPRPMAWIASGGTWVAQELTALDPASNEGTALAVATQADGSVVAVGAGREGSVQNVPLVWRMEGTGGFGLPMRLQGLRSRADAQARGVNDRGRVVGWASSGLRTYAVMWQLP